MELHYTVVGIPKPQARPKVFHRTLKSGKPFVSTYSPKTDWFHLVYTESLKQKEMLKNRLVGALELNIIFCMPIPKSISKKKRLDLHYVTKKPDLDNLVKAVMDAINNVGLWEDDSQIARIYASKIYSEEPRCMIGIKEIIDGN
ncbi:MAG: RusA family crossover junction endodeoxyribonuclease [Bacteroidales bacterium]|nr:RusA family crossover junction endodeoxyribonuclease [Bacteroidales bacterium]